MKTHVGHFWNNFMYDALHYSMFHLDNMMNLNDWMDRNLLETLKLVQNCNDCNFSFATTHFQR